MVRKSNGVLFERHNKTIIIIIIIIRIIIIEKNGPELIELDEILDKFVQPSNLLQ